MCCMVGFFVPIGRVGGGRLSRFMPSASSSPRVFMPCSLFFRSFGRRAWSGVRVVANGGPQQLCATATSRPEAAIRASRIADPMFRCKRKAVPAQCGDRSITLSDFGDLTYSSPGSADLRVSGWHRSRSRERAIRNDSRRS